MNPQDCGAAPGVLTLVDKHVTAAPEATALVADGLTRSYSQLDAEARHYAALLAEAGAGREDVVAVVAQRDPRYVAMVLGVLRAGAAFLPIEPGTPVDRARTACAAAGVRVVLAQPDLTGYATDLVSEVVVADAAVPTTNVVDPVRDPGGLAYVIFTSGSTGTPKGAMVTDGGMANHIAAKTADLGLGTDDVIGLTAPLSFDISVWQALTALTTGGRVCVAAPENLAEPVELVAWVRRHQVSVLEIVPSFLAVLVDQLADDAELRAGLVSLRSLIATGEALPSALVRRWYACCPDIPVVNAYGPTECSDDVTHHVVTAAECAEGDWPAIGREVRGTRVHVLDDDGAECASATAGALTAGGLGVGRGYIGDPVRTALAFVPDHLSGHAGARLYRTGDRGLRAADGALHYLGRTDRQVKVRGHRVELGDVEACLLRVPDVATAACVLVEDRLHAFVTIRPGADVTADDVLAAVRTIAPAFLVPQEIRPLDGLPTTTAGKVDHRALAALVTAGPAPASELGDGPVPDDALPDAVLAAFTEALGAPVADPAANFFAAGGDSLSAMGLVSAARKRFDAPAASLRGFLSDPTPRGLLEVLRTARAVEATEPADAPPVPGALSSGQERLWFLEQLLPRKGAQLIRVQLRLHGDLDRAALQHAMDAVVARHEPLRTVFGQHRGVPSGTVWSSAGVAIEDVTPDEGTLHAELVDGDGISVRTPRPPLMRARLARVGPREHVLTLLLHHLVADGWSLAVLAEELGQFYQRRVDGDSTVPLPENTFGQYVSAERQWLAATEAAECEQYWTNSLHGAPLVLDLPLDHPRPAKPEFTATHVVRELSRDDTAALVRFAREHGATPFMAVFAAFTGVLRDLTGCDDLVIGLDTVNRSWPGSDRLIGTFVNQLPVRMNTRGLAPGPGPLLELARGQCLGAYEHERLPFHKIVAAVNPPRQAGRFPLFQTKVTHQSAWRHGVELAALRVVPDEFGEPVTDLDLMLDVSGEEDVLRLELVHRKEIVDSPTAAGWLDRVCSSIRDSLRATTRR